LNFTTPEVIEQTLELEESTVIVTASPDDALAAGV
jgi:hypothetical protein